MRGRKFRAKEKLRILNEWDKTTKGAKRAARQNLCSVSSIWKWHALVADCENTTEDELLKLLENRSSRPRRFRDAHTEQEAKNINAIIEQNPYIGRLELYSILRTEFSYRRSIRTLYRHIRKIGFVPAKQITEHKPKPYDTPKYLGVKWQIDVKYVPTNCLREIPDSKYYYPDGSRLYQYTCIDEATRKRFLYMYGNFGAKQTKDFIKRCILFFGYKPLIVQTDNGFEFCNFTETGGRKQHRKNKNGYSHVFTDFLYKNGIRHDLIKVATPRHNGKVERSHRIDNEEFYCYHTEASGFKCLAEAREYLKGWVIRYNTRRASSVLGYKTPQEVENAMMLKLRQDNVVKYFDLERPKGRGGNTHPSKVERTGNVSFTPQNINWAFAPRPIQ